MEQLLRRLEDAKQDFGHALMDIVRAGLMEGDEAANVLSVLRDLGPIVTFLINNKSTRRQLERFIASSSSRP